LIPPRPVAAVHSEQLGGKERRLLTSRAGAHLEDDVAAIVRVGRQQQHLEILLDLLQTGCELGDLCFGHLAHLVIVRLGHDLARSVEFVGGRSVDTIGGHNGFELSQFLRHLARTMGIDGDLGIGLLGKQILVFLGDFFETIQHDALAMSRPRS
jgi:hypothetical protein